MATNSTKILQYDLDDWISKLLEELKKIQGIHASFEDVFKNINVEQMTGDTKKIMQDLIDGYNNDGKGLTIDRLQKVEASIKGLGSDLLIEGNFKEVFTYDPIYGNVTKHDVTGDKMYSVIYNYSDAENGVLSTSVQTSKDSKNQDVKITKTYKYDSLGNITDIDTVTVITPVVI